MLPTEDDIVERGLNRLTSQFQGKPVIEAMLSAYLEELSLVRDDLFQLLNERGVSTAVGQQLDILGKIVNEPRLGRGDEEYRDAIYLRIFINNSEGTPEDVMSALKLITQADRVAYWEHHPTSVHLLTTGTSIPDELCEYLKNVVPAGVSIPRVILDPYEDTWLPCEIGEDQDRGIMAEIDDANVVQGYLQQSSPSPVGNIIFNESGGNSGLILVDYPKEATLFANYGITAELVTEALS